MGWSIPDKGEGQNDLQSILFQEYLDVLVAGLLGSECVLSGLAVTAQGSPDMTVAVAKGSVISQGTLFAVAASASVAIGAADATNPRLDLVVVNSAGAIAVRAGTAAAAPKPPARTAGDVALAVVYVPATDTTVSTDQITDLRVIRGGAAAGGGAPFTLKKVTTPVVVNTTNVIQTLFSLTVPDGLLVAGQAIRVVCGGTYLNNSGGTAAWTWTISFGGVTIFADATAATASDADRGAWRIEFELVCQASTDLILTGIVMMQTPGAKTAAATGIGDLAVVTHVNAPIAGVSTVNTDTGNNDLLVRVTHAVSNAAVETALELAYAELI